MIALSGPSEKAIRAQIAESVSLIAELDFPERWPDLIDVRQQSTPVVLPSIHSHVPPIATRPISQWRRFQRQPWRTGNSALNLPFMALPSPLGRVLVHH
jgi:exportin-2 (importin alpha re-exporter)